MTTTYPVHELAQMLPDMREDEFQRHKASIKEHGQKKPIAVWRGTILDGRHRLRACNELELSPKYATLPPDIDPVAYILVNNVDQRHMNESQIGLVIARLNKWSVSHGGDRRSQQFQDQPPPSRADTAEQTGISSRTLGRATTVLDKGTPELVDAVKNGNVSLRDAAKVAQRTEAEQNNAVNAVLSGQSRTASSALAAPPAPVQPPSPAPVNTPPPAPPARIVPDAQRIADLESEVRYLRAQVDADTDQDTEFTRLRGEITTLQASVNNWQTRYHELEVENRNLRRRLGEA